jgi:D-galactose 1-dehydrogenase/L-arabinose 1- dehydrogenase
MPGAKIRVGLVGLGKIARDQHLPALAADSRYELVATASPDGASAGVPAFAGLEALLAAGIELDAVSLCTPPAVRAGLARQALAAGLHVMLEKPPALSASEAAGLEPARRPGRTLFAAWHSRETGAVDAAAQWLADRPILSVEVVWREDVRVWHPGQDWLLAEGGFGVFDPAINALSILTRILPAPLALSSADLFVPGNRAAPMAARLALRTGAAPVSADLSILAEGPPQWDISVRTADGDLMLGAGGHSLSIDGVPRPSSDNAEYPRLYRRFASLIDGAASDFDLIPLAQVDQAMARGQVHSIADFHFA